MSVETIEVHGEPTLTLKELLKPGLRAVFVGINPSPVSVTAGHYYQGKLGKRFRSRIQTAGIARDLSAGEEDDVAFKQGMGFIDIVRRPTSRSSDLTDDELKAGVSRLAARLEVARGALLVFVFMRAYDAAAAVLMAKGWSVERMPGPYEAGENVTKRMNDLAMKLR